MKSVISKTFISGFILFITFYADAQQLSSEKLTIPEEKGINGFLCPLFGYVNFENNLIHQFGIIKSSTDIPYSLSSNPIKQNSFVFSIPFDLEYTVRPQKTSFYLKNFTENYLLYESSQQIGIKQRLRANGILNLGFTFYDLGTKVWKDPFDMNKINNSISQEGIGFETSISEINGTGLSIEYKYRNIKIQQENSGSKIDLLPIQIELLDRNGSKHTLSLLYNHQFDEKHQIEPLFQLDKRLSRGKAISHTGYKAGVSYNFRNNTFLFTTSIYSLYFTYDEENPVYYTKQQDQAWEISAMTAIENPWNIKLIGSKSFRFIFRTGYVHKSSNIDFFSTSNLCIQTGLCFFL